MRDESIPAETPYEWRRDGWLAACSLTAALLVISALTPHAPGFDTFLRVFVFCMAVVRGLAGFRKGGAWLPLSAAVIAILFNPVRPIGMSAIGSVWCDLIAAAWFAVVGAWQLLRSWDPQRGWALAALSLGALAVPAVGALNAPNRDALTAPNLNQNLDENLAVMNSNGSSTATATAPGVNATSASAKPADTASLNATAPVTSDRVIHNDREVSAQTNAATKPPPAESDAAATANQALNEAPDSDAPVNSTTDENEE